MITERDQRILLLVWTYCTLTRTQITAGCFRGDRGGGMSRKRLAYLAHEGLLNRTRMQVVNPSMGAPQWVYYPSTKGCEYLAAALKDERYLRGCTRAPNWTHLYHWTQGAELHIRFDQAVSCQKEVGLEHWVNEWHVANPDEKAPEKRYTLFTVLDEKPRLVCAPDAGFVVTFRGFR